MPIEVKITKDQTIPGQAPEVQGAKTEPGKQSVQNQAVNAALITAGKQVLTQGVTQYADLTGNYVAAENFNNVLSIGSDIAILATGPVGWVAIGTKTALNISNSFTKQTIAVRSIALQQQRAGVIAKQGSRY